jgi:BirA family biotin operon repressor/biotin-[acetyl-CoA-carboxylase] ligase
MERRLEELSPKTAWIGRRLDLYRELDSTNLLAEDLAARGVPEGSLVVADGQTRGRGRLGRSFFSPPGTGLYLSLLLRPRIPAARAPEHVFAAAVAVAATARELLPASQQIEIKWPNDVLVAGRKLSGINLPAHFEDGRICWLVLGIGVNVNLAAHELPPELREIATSLRIAGGERVDRVAFAEALLARLEREIDLIRADRFSQVLEAWRDFFRMQGARVRVGGPGVAHEIEGTVRGIEGSGALLVESGHTLERVIAGDVTLLERTHELRES